MVTTNFIRLKKKCGDCSSDLFYRPAYSSIVCHKCNAVLSKNVERDAIKGVIKHGS